MYVTSCMSCGTVYANEEHVAKCSKCGGLINFEYDYDKIELPWPVESMWDFAPLLPISHSEKIVSLGEGNTPLIEARFDPSARIFLKDETRNPTGSMKDRAESVAISKANEFGVDTAMVFTTGSVGISASAYASRAGMSCVVLVPRGTPESRWFPAYLLGGVICEADMDTDQAMDVLDECCSKGGFYEATTCRRSNPYQAEASKTIAYELFKQFGGMPDWVVVPVGGGGTLCGIWKGLKELVEMDEADRLPRLVGVQAKYYDSLVRAFDRGITDEETIRHLLDDVEEHDTTLVKLNHRFPHDGMAVLAAVRESEGVLVSVDDEECLAATLEVGRTEGMCIEPSAATGIAAIKRLMGGGTIRRDESVVVIITGSGFRELDMMSDLVKVDKKMIGRDHAAEEISNLVNAMRQQQSAC